MRMTFQSGRNPLCLMLAIWAVIPGPGTLCLSQGEAKPALRGMVVDHVGALVANLTIEILPRPAESAAAQPEKLPAVIQAKTDDDGQFSASLLPGTYQVCVPRFARSCRTIEIKPSITPEYLVLKIGPGDHPYGPTAQKSVFEQIAGPSAKNCGHILMGKDPSHATNCAMRAFKHHKPFFVIYDEPCIDCVSASGIAWNSKGEPYSVSYDSMGISFELQLPDYKMPEGSDTRITRCSQPIQVYVDKAGQLDCFKAREM